MRDRYRSEPAEYEIWTKGAAPDQASHKPRARLGNGLQEQIRNVQEDFYNNQAAQAWCLTPNLKESLPALHAEAIRLCSGDDGELLTQRQRLQKIFFYLTTSGEFTYTLNQTIKDKSIDPVEDFLINRKSGHCEYFASAAALMLQSVDIPARVVNGFKGCDLNAVSGRYEVKEKYGHTWIEAFVEGDWETYDPTPAAPRAELVKQGSQLDWWTDLRLAFNDGWFNTIQKMSIQKQEAFIRPWLNAGKKWMETIKEQGILASIKLFITEVLLDPSRWVSIETWIATFFLLLVPSLIFRANPIKKLWQLIQKLASKLGVDSRPQKSIIRFYENFRNTCQSHGLEMRPNRTAMENAADASSFFSDRLRDEPDRKLPFRIADTFNRVRFGNDEMNSDIVAEIRKDVARFAELLKSNSAKTSV